MAIPEKLMDGIQRLDPLPITLQKLTAALQDEKAGCRGIAEILEYDGAVAANILRVANSGAYGGRYRTETIGDAVVRLGTTNLLNIILGDHLKSLGPAPMYNLTENDFWAHSAASSLAVKAIMAETNPYVFPKIAGIAALLHDIGKLLIVRYMHVDVSAVVSLAQEHGIPFVDAERMLLGCDHTEVGAGIARRWNFPTEVAHAIEHHHSILEEPEPLIDAVMLANLAAKSVGAGMGADGMNFRIDYSGSRERLGLTLQGFERACAQTAVWLDELRKLNAIPDRRTNDINSKRRVERTEKEPR